MQLLLRWFWYVEPPPGAILALALALAVPLFPLPFSLEPGSIKKSGEVSWRRKQVSEGHIVGRQHVGAA